ncbi:hypothetical protein [Actinomadura parmotrematis]|uniref:ABM domain-containing protein n=1 Tax=Actinomadura parmotrematis TaxID=2864039 RepID=A0ABS7FLK8_9ACTN|nr:hypothetical protein [Actinomadura parmotrematis]MBW8481135.1 hypothetical protein [Actinomadura parmotrematis]
MHAAFVTIRIDPERAPQAAAALMDDVLPRLKAAPGFVGGHWMEPRDGDGLAVLLFATEDDAERGALAGLDGPVPGVTVRGVEIRRVAVSVP